jgi:hypothetical protein
VFFFWFGLVWFWWLLCWMMADWLDEVAWCGRKEGRWVNSDIYTRRTRVSSAVFFFFFSWRRSGEVEYLPTYLKSNRYVN